MQCMQTEQGGEESAYLTFRSLFLKTGCVNVLGRLNVCTGSAARAGSAVGGDQRRALPSSARCRTAGCWRRQLAGRDLSAQAACRHLTCICTAECAMCVP